MGQSDIAFRGKATSLNTENPLGNEHRFLLKATTDFVLSTKVSFSDGL